MCREEYAPDDPAGEVGAYQPTPTGAIIRTRGVQRNGEWVNVLEVVGAEGEVVVELFVTRRGLAMDAVYNRVIDPFVDGSAADAAL